jgi:hypothetical protein
VRLTRTGGPELVSWPTTPSPLLVRRARGRVGCGYAAMFSAVLLAGCPDAKSGGAPKHCTTAYEQCVLPNGVLGVCDSVECTEGQAPPCLVCRSQH